MKTAKLVKDNLDGFKGHAALYKLSTPVNIHDGKKTTYVVCSTVDATFTGWETYIFPANKKGEVLDWLELDGSQRGTTSHIEVLNAAGYTLVQ